MLQLFSAKRKPDRVLLCRTPLLHCMHISTSDHQTLHQFISILICHFPGNILLQVTLSAYFTKTSSLVSCPPTCLITSHSETAFILTEVMCHSTAWFGCFDPISNRHFDPWYRKCHSHSLKLTEIKSILCNSKCQGQPMEPEPILTLMGFVPAQKGPSSICPNQTECRATRDFHSNIYRAVFLIIELKFFNYYTGEIYMSLLWLYRLDLV